MYKETVASDPDSDNGIKLKNDIKNGSIMEFKNLFSVASARNKNDLFKTLTGFITNHCIESKITEQKDSIKITYEEQNRFTIIQLFFEKSKVLVRYNLKSHDHLIMSEPNMEFIKNIFGEMEKLGYHQLYKDNDEMLSTCRMEFIKGK